jgi:hypothetical protein
MTMESAGTSIVAGLEKIRSLVRYIIQSHDDADFSQASGELRAELAAIPAHQRKFIVALAVGSNQTTALLQRMAL